MLDDDNSQSLVLRRYFSLFVLELFGHRRFVDHKDPPNSGNEFEKFSGTEDQSQLLERIIARFEPSDTW